MVRLPKVTGRLQRSKAVCEAVFWAGFYDLYDLLRPTDNFQTFLYFSTLDYLRYIYIYLPYVINICVEVVEVVEKVVDQGVKKFYDLDFLRPRS
jgi:hypothetical protein